MCVTGSGQSLVVDSPLDLLGRKTFRPYETKVRIVLHRKEVIQPHLPIQLPCYDLAPINGLTLGVLPLAVG